VCLLRGTDWIFIYGQFNIQQFYVLPTQCIYVFYVDLRTNSDICLTARYELNVYTYIILVDFPPVTIILPTLHAHLFQHVALTTRTNGRSLVAF